MFACAHRLVTKDELVSQGPTLVTGFILNASVDGGSVEIYDGIDPVSGLLVMDINGWANDVNFASFNPPVLFNNGLYVDVVSNVHRFTIFFIPLRGSSPLQAYPGFMMSEDGS